MPPKIGDSESQKALRSYPGLCVLSSLAMAPHGFSFRQATELVPRSPEDDGNELKIMQWIRLHDVYLARRRTMEKTGEGTDWSETWLEGNTARFASEYGLKECGDLTLDQYEWLCSAGKADEFNQYDIQAAIDDLPARIAAIQAALGNGEMGVPPSTP